MKKALRILVTALALLAIMVIPVIAGGPKADKGDRGRSGKAAKPNVGDVSLEPTDDDDGGPPEGKGWRRDGARKGGKTGPAGKSNVAHLYLYEKDANWDIVPGGAWGKMKYNLAGPTFDFVFNGHGLDPDTEYSLIYYADPWSGNNPGALIASGTTNRGGNIHLADSVELDMDLPDPADNNYEDGDGCGDPEMPNPPGELPCGGAKIWLVPSGDYEEPNMTAWNPTEYLFENNLISYDDTGV